LVDGSERVGGGGWVVVREVGVMRVLREVEESWARDER
jgi:hypothetical protein